MKTHVAALGLSTAAAASILAYRAATAHGRDDRALAAWLHHTSAHNLQSVVSKYLFGETPPNSAAAGGASGAAAAEEEEGVARGVARGGDASTSAAAGSFARDPPPPPSGGGGGSDTQVERKPIDTTDEASRVMPSSSSALPDDFVCPIGAFVMIDPVLCGCTPTCGKSFDRRSIERWVTLGAGTCPHTGRRLTLQQLYPNRNLRNVIEDWVEQHGMPEHSAPPPHYAVPDPEVSAAAAAAARAAAAEEAAAAAVVDPFHRLGQSDEATAAAGLALFTHVVILQSKHQLIAPSMFHVTNLTPPGSDGPKRWRTTLRFAPSPRGSPRFVSHCTKRASRLPPSPRAVSPGGRSKCCAG
jgi:hypothetical protein